MHFYNKTENTVQNFILQTILKVCCSSIISQRSTIHCGGLILSKSEIVFSFIFTSIDVHFFSLGLAGLGFINIYVQNMFIRSILIMKPAHVTANLFKIW